MSYPLVCLGDVADFINGVAFKPEDWGTEGKPIIRIQNLNDPLKEYNYTEREVKDTNIARKGDLLVSWSASLGVYEWTGQDACINQHIFKVVPNNEKIDKTYLKRALELSIVEMESQVHGATMKHITRGKFLANQIPLPPLAEQRRIASILDQADELRQKRQQAIEKLDQLLQATFIDMFGDPVSNPKGWNLGRLGDVIHSAKDGPHVSPSYSETGIPFLSTRHVRAGKIVWGDLKFITEEDAQIHWKKCKPTRGDILYTKGGTTGLAAVVDTDLDFAVWVHVALLKTNHDKVRSEWLVSMLNTQYCYEQSQRYTHGIANRDLGLKRMVNIEMYIPPLDEQDKFVNFKNKLLKNNLLFESSYSSLEQLFKSLQNQAFNGTL
ncbi:restriction endonuclease subunit S [Acinetobacter variabilis]|uniref:restriction endonuclease subunit S n=1 Tax=Acinetobacter variabilis TaxID=70346 RepID=UPI000F659F87|nr:restriction endonuclease subunit S [Acinetobacter variabilis]QXR18984.1 restriction endonuclease subunit S [Acinetobacter variabilis]